MNQKLLLCITALLLSIGAIAQTIVIGAGAQSGTSSNGATGDPGPMYRSSATSSFVYSTHHYLYTQAELAGLPIGAVVTNLAWNKDNNAASNSNFLFQIWMKNSALTAVQTPPQTLAALTTGSTSVYNSSATAVTNAIGYVDFVLTTPFVYTGGAIEITVNFNISSGSSPWTTAGFSWKKDPITNRTLSYCGNAANTTLGNLRTVRPQLRITYSASSCANPSALMATGVTQTGANLSWTAAAGSIGYEYVVDQNAGNPAGAGTPVAGTTATASGLTSSTTYYLHVRNKCSASSFSPWITISFVTAACPAVTGLNATAITQTAATLSWSAVAGSGGYEYVIDQNAASPSGPGSGTVNTTVNISALTSSTTYYLHVRNMCGPTSISAWSTIPFITLDCPQPGNLAASNITSSTASISWSAVPGYPDYEYVLDQNPANPAGAGMPTTATFFMATGLQQNSDYYLHVRNMCAATSISAWVTLNFKTGECAPPVNILSGNIKDTSADLLWSQMLNVNYYQYKVTQTPPAAFTGAGFININKFTTHIGGLQPVTKYYVYVRSNCYVADSSDWGIDSFVTLATCDVPAVVLTGQGSNNPTAAWPEVQGALGYEYAVTNDQLPPALGAQTLNTNLTLPLPADGKEYHLHVRTICSSFTIYSWWNSQLLRQGSVSVTDAAMNTGFDIYPNPAQKELHVQGAAGAYTIHDLSGRLLLTGSSSQKDYSVEVGSLAPGIYVFRAGHFYKKFNKN